MYIALEGCHGIGKTTLCENLSSKYHWTFIKELKDNLLPPPKIGPEGDTFRSQMWFLNQLIYKEYQISRDNGIYIADRSKNSVLIYSKASMNDYDLDIFKGILRHCDLKEPDIELILYAEDKTILDRIKQRGRNGWSEENTNYLEKINSSFKKYYEEYEQVKNLHLVDASGTEKQTLKIIEDTIKKNTRILF